MSTRQTLHLRTMRRETWTAGRWTLAVFGSCRIGWYADLTEWSYPDASSRRYAVTVDLVHCRSRSRAVDVGRRMLSRALRGAPHVER